MSRTIRDYLQLFIPVILILVLDQYTKHLVRTNLALGETWMPLEWLAPYARFVHWTNSGVAFGLFQGKGMMFSLIAVAVSVAVIYYYPRIKREDWALRTALVLQMAGALGNLIDRVRFNGKVTDFVSVGSFAVFNVADACITVGVFILLLGVYQQDRHAHRAQPDRGSEGETDTMDGQGS